MQKQADPPKMMLFLSQVSIFSMWLSSDSLDKQIIKWAYIRSNFSIMKTPKPLLLPPLPDEHSKANRKMSFHQSMRCLTVSHGTNKLKEVQWSEETRCASVLYPSKETLIDLFIHQTQSQLPIYWA